MVFENDRTVKLVMLELTQSAMKAIRRVIAQAENDVLGLRVTVSVGGCAGFQYGIGLEAMVRDDDEVIEVGDIKVFVDPDSRPWLTGVEIDFREDPLESGFVFNNPNALGKCSCGKAFAG